MGACFPMLFFRFWPHISFCGTKLLARGSLLSKLVNIVTEACLFFTDSWDCLFKNIFSWPQNQDSTHLTFSSQISTWGCSTQRFRASNVAIVGKMDSNTISDLIMDRIISSPFALMLAFAEINFYNKILGNILRYEGKGILLSRIRQKISWRVSYRVGVPSKR